jgi:mannose-1-phosphate guanylyltransferase
MNSSETTCGNTWAIVLAAGEGSRLHSLTTTESGIAIPKQFCSLHGYQPLNTTRVQEMRQTQSSIYTEVCPTLTSHAKSYNTPRQYCVYYL